MAAAPGAAPAAAESSLSAKPELSSAPSKKPSRLARVRSARAPEPTAAEAMEAEMRRRILLMCKRSYWNQLEHGRIGRDAVRTFAASPTRRCSLTRRRSTSGPRCTPRSRAPRGSTACVTGSSPRSHGPSWTASRPMRRARWAGATISAGACASRRSSCVTMCSSAFSTRGRRR